MDMRGLVEEGRAVVAIDHGGPATRLTSGRPRDAADAQ
jgi:hypothetical protein